MWWIEVSVPLRAAHCKRHCSVTTCREGWTITMFTNRTDTVAHGNTQCTPSAHSAMANCSALWLPPSILMRAYERILFCPFSLSNVHANTAHTCRSVCVCVLVCVFATWTCINTEKRRANNMWSVFVPVAGNWRVFIRLMDMKRKGEKGMKMEWGRTGGSEDGRVGGPLNYTTTNSVQWPNKSYCGM